MAFTIKDPHRNDDKRIFYAIDQGTYSRIVIGRNNTRDSRDADFYIAVGRATDEHSPYLDNGRAIALSDEQMQELFAAYLIVRKEYVNLNDD